jgi:hypothetical protein
MKTLWRKFVKWQPFENSGMSDFQQFLLIVFTVAAVRIFFSFI